MTSGLTIGGALRSTSRWSLVILKPATVIVSIVGRLQLQPWPTRVWSPVQPVLPAGEALVVGAYVLDEQQAPAGLEHPVEFAKRSRLVVDRAQDEGGDGDVEAVVLERQILGGSA